MAGGSAGDGDKFGGASGRSAATWYEDGQRGRCSKMGRVSVGQFASDGRGVDSMSLLLLHPVSRNSSAIATSKA